MTYGPLYPAFGAYLVLSLAFSLLLLSRKLHFLIGVERLQVQFVLFGIGIAAVGGSITNLLFPLIFRTSRLNVYGPIFGLVMGGFIAHAIVRYRLLNIRLVVRRGVTEVGASLIAAVAFLVLAEITSWLLAIEPQALPLAVTLILALVVAQVFQPLRSGVQSGLDYYFFRTPYDYAAALREISRSMGDIIDLNCSSSTPVARSRIRCTLSALLSTLETPVAPTFGSSLPGVPTSRPYRAQYWSRPF